MAAAAKDRNRASRIRRKVRDNNATPSERRWLDGYERQRDGSPRREAPPPPRRARETPAHAPRAEMPTQAPAVVESPIDDFPISFDAPDGPLPQTSSGAAKGPAAPSACMIPDCPACKGMKGAAICGTTGRKVWPPMSEAGARGMAGMVLGVIAMAVRFFRADRTIVPPTDEEKRELAIALREVALRRASWVGAFDDLLALGEALRSYTWRALRAPSKEPERAAPLPPPPPQPEPVAIEMDALGAA